MTTASNMAGLFGDARPAHRASTDAHSVSDRSPTLCDLPLKLAPASAGASFEVTLPLPPSTNNLFKNIKRGRAKTSPYRDWIDAAGWNLRQVGVAPLRGRYELTIMIPAGMRGDISNRIKAVEDLLVAHKLTDDDSRCDAVIARRHERIAPKTCTVVVKLSPTSSAALTGAGGGPRPLPVSLQPEGAEAA